MPAFPIGKRFYPCVTQNGYTPTLGYPPNAPGGSPWKEGASGLMVGIMTLIPRWAKPANLLYYVVKDGFSEDDFTHTAKSFQEAADEWNDLDFGVNISATTNRAQANFLVKYFEPEEADDLTLASAFFPNKVGDVLVYRTTLVEPECRKVLRNTFLHEIGHILGLRHEFANEDDPEKPGKKRESLAHLFGSVNPHSVMSYDDVNNINELDKEDVKAFYQLANGSKINGARVTDYLPKPLSQK
ncbi:hypothetical protein QBC43DRAFT_289008 [Cladorrhinum sp. PSN259]|nr:hypothetical protein QBC43DRAFT_289008 [Cladorrhinum sp. PSN259]